MVEVLASLFLVTVAIIAAWQLWDDAFRLLDATGRSLGDPSFAAAAVVIRADVQLATALPQVSERPSSGPLELPQRSGENVIFELRDGILTRCASRPAVDLQCRPLVRRVEGWEWQTVSPGLIEVRVGLGVHVDPFLVANRRDYPRRRWDRVHRVESIRAGVRGFEGGASW